MNTKSKVMPLAASLSLLLWAGCATEKGFRGDFADRPINLLEDRVDTYSGARTGLDQYADRYVIILPVEDVIIEEAAGSRRPE